MNKSFIDKLKDECKNKPNKNDLYRRLVEVKAKNIYRFYELDEMSYKTPIQWEEYRMLKEKYRLKPKNKGGRQCLKK